MKNNPNKNKENKKDNSKSEFNEDTLFYLSEIQERKEDAQDFLCDVQREYLCHIAKSRCKDDEIDKANLFFYLIKQLFRFK